MTVLEICPFKSWNEIVFPPGLTNPKFPITQTASALQTVMLHTSESTRSIINNTRSLINLRGVSPPQMWANLLRGVLFSKETNSGWALNQLTAALRFTEHCAGGVLTSPFFKPTASSIRSVWFFKLGWQN